MSGAGELILHIGDPKTGTTAIQDALLMRAFSIDGQPSEGQLLYPTSNNHNRLALSFFRNDLIETRPDVLKPIVERLRKFPKRRAILSGEAFDSTDPELVHAEFTRAMPERMERVRVIAYVRPHASRFLSAYAERIKTGEFSGSMEKLWDGLSNRPKRNLDHTYFEFAPRFEKWRDVFGDRFTLRPFVSRELLAGDVVRDFLGWVYGDAHIEVTQPEVSNPSLSLAQLAVLEHLHGASRGKGRFRVARRSLGWNLGRALAFSEPDVASGKPWLHRALTKRIAESCIEDARRIDREFFDGRPLMAEALETAHARAQPDPMPPLSTYLTPELRGFADAFRLLTLEMMKADAPSFIRLMNATEGPMIRKAMHGDT